MSNVKVSKIVIEIGKKTLVFSPEEIAELQRALNTLYPPPAKVTKETIYVDRYRDWPWPKPYYGLISSSSNASDSLNISYKDFLQSKHQMTTEKSEEEMTK